jgi:glycine cleavage system T protein (aminomethyltransferase)
MPATSRSSILRGLLPEDPFLETYLVRAGGLTVVALGPDDRLTLIDAHGGQVAELTVLSETGRDESEAIGARADAPATVIRRLAGGDGAVFHALGLPRLEPDEALAALVFDEKTPPGASQSFVTDRAVTAVVAAPAGRIVDGAPPPSDLVVEVRRAVARKYGQIELPAPLAEPRLDFRIEKATALSYEVKAGEYIQVIDVEGKQCSDFLAFRRERLEEGVERGLDATVTRSLMGNAYPQPGLHGKFYDADMNPLVEVVQDTVGRHDTFALACNPKYYEDLGYPGHVNCTDNFNAALDPFRIAKRKGWPALNFFFNTSFGSDNVLVVDEPWSRPGDYVLLRAMTDLVCASSACPDDVDPANGWQVTDVHVRVYPETNTFSQAIAHRVTPDAEAVLTKETAFHPRTSELTKSFVEYRGYWLPHCFSNEDGISEYWACRERAAVMDLSPLRKWEILGPDAESLVQWTITRDARKLGVGQVTYTAVCNETGGMIDDATVFRLGRDNFRFVGGDEYDGVWLREQAERQELKVWIKPSTDQLHNIAVQGPASRDLLRELVWTPPTQTPFEDLKWFRFTVGRLRAFDGTPIVVSRTGYTGELGYELWCHPDDGPAVWDAVWEAGEPRGLKPLGLDALDILRIEAGLIFAGYEFDDQIDPFEAGIPFVVDLQAEDDFVGRAALEERREHPQHALVGLELDGNETAGHGDGVYVGRQQVGVVTSGTRSPVLKKNIALCRIAVQYRDLGTEVEVGKLDGQQKRIPATVVRIPFYDPDKTRPRS